MKKYVIACNNTEKIYWAYRKILGMWGIITAVSGTCSSTMEECEEALREVVHSKQTIVKIALLLC